MEIINKKLHKTGKNKFYNGKYRQGSLTLIMPSAWLQSLEFDHKLDLIALEMHKSKIILRMIKH